MPRHTKLKRPRPPKAPRPKPGPAVALPLTAAEVAAVQVGLGLLAQLLILGKLPPDAGAEAVAQLAAGDGQTMTPDAVVALKFRIDPEPAVHDVKHTREDE